RLKIRLDVIERQTMALAVPRRQADPHVFRAPALRALPAAASKGARANLGDRQDHLIARAVRALIWKLDVAARFDTVTVHAEHPVPSLLKLVTRHPRATE